MKNINKKLLAGLLARCFFSLIILLIIVSISVSLVIGLFEKNVIDIVETNVYNNINLIEKNIMSDKEVGAKIAENFVPKVNYTINNGGGNFALKLKEQKDELSRYYIKSDRIKNIVIQNDINDFALDFTTAYGSRMEFYKIKLVSPNKTSEQLLSLSENNVGFDLSCLCENSDGEQVIPFYIPTPIMRKRTGTVTVYIGKEELLHPLNEMIDSGSGIFLIRDKAGNVVKNNDAVSVSFSENYFLDKDNVVKINNEKYYLFNSTGKYSGLEYTVLFPEKYVLSDVAYYRTIFFVISCIIFIIGIFMCFVIAMRKSKSHIELFERIGLNPETVNMKHFIKTGEYREIAELFTRIKDENAFLLENEKQSVLQRAFNNRLNNESIAYEFEIHNMKFLNKLYLVMTISFSVEEDFSLNTKTFFVNNIYENFDDAQIYAFENGKLAIIISVESVDYEDSLKKWAMQIKKTIFSDSIYYSIGVSAAFDDLSLVPNRYQQSLEASEYNFLLKKEDILFFDKLPLEYDRYYYPIDVENAIYKSVIAMDCKQACKILEEIKKENFVKRKLCVAEIKKFLNEIRVTINKTSMLLTEPIEFLEKKCPVDRFFEHLVDFLHIVCETLQKENQAKSQHDSKCEEIEKYIRKNYSNINLSLNDISKSCNLHPNYISSMYKKVKGISVVSFIEIVRVEEAVKLLNETDMTVNEISAAVGFSHPNTLRRSFKKVKGVSPIQYKNDEN